MSRLSAETRAHLRKLPSGSLSAAEVAILLDELEDTEQKLDRCQEANRHALARSGILTRGLAEEKGASDG